MEILFLCLCIGNANSSILLTLLVIRSQLLWFAFAPHISRAIISVGFFEPPVTHSQETAAKSAAFSFVKDVDAITTRCWHTGLFWDEMVA